MAAIRYILVCISILSQFPCYTQSQDLDSLLMIMEGEMVKREIYDSQVYQNIETLRNLRSNPELAPAQVFDYNNQLIRAYEKFSFDSTYKIIDENISLAQEIANPQQEAQLYIKLAEVLSNAGRSKEAEDALKKVAIETLPLETFIFYCKTARKLFSDLSYYSIEGAGSSNYEELYHQYSDTLIVLLDSSSLDYLAILEKDFRDQRALDKAREINDRRLAMSEIGTRDYAVIAFERSLIYQLKGDQEHRKQFLILSVISDIRAAVKDNASLMVLANMVFEEGQVEKAHEYIQFAFEDAQFFNSRLRFQEISTIMSNINEAYQERLAQQRSDLQRYLIIISVLSVFLLLTTVLVYRQMKRLARTRNTLRETNERLQSVNDELFETNQKLRQLYQDLSEANHIKEQYIGSFLGIFSNFIDKLDAYRKMVKKKLANRKYEELYNQVKDDELITVELENFYKTFDQTFLNIYPTFIQDLNDLLIPEERITLKSNEILNTELRVFALIRLGITDSSKIANLLKYSVNTIYNYRVKIKNKAAVPREEFEDHVARIGSYQNNETNATKSD